MIATQVKSTTLLGNWQEINCILASLIARCWTNDDFKQRFMGDPKFYLQETGLEIPEGIAVKVDESATHWRIEQSPDYSAIVFVVPLPHRPEHFSEEVLSQWEDSFDKGLPATCTG